MLKLKVCCRLFCGTVWFLCHSDLLQQISREVAQLASSADLQVAAFLVSFLHHNLKNIDNSVVRQSADRLVHRAPCNVLILGELVVCRSVSVRRMQDVYLHLLLQTSVPDLSSVWSVPSLCSPQRSASPWKLFQMLALLWGSWWESSLSSRPSFPKKYNEPALRLNGSFTANWNSKFGDLDELTLHHSSLESSRTMIRSPGLLCKHIK